MPRVGQKQSEAAKKKISENSAQKGKPAWNRGIKVDYKPRPNAKGRIFSLETRKKLSEARKGYTISEEIRRKIGEGNKGKHISEESKRKMSISAIALGRIGAKHPSWKGGISKIDRNCRRMPEYKKWRSDVFQRDNWTCQTCRIRGVYITAHHIKSFKNLIMENNIKTIIDARNCPDFWDLTNGVTLCEECHKLTDNYKGRANTNI